MSCGIMSNQTRVFLILLIISNLSLTSSIHKTFCGESRTYLEPIGTIETNEHVPLYENCTWSIKTSNNSVIYIQFIYLMLDDYEYDNSKINCLSIRNPNNATYFRICNNNMTDIKGMSVPSNQITINLEIKSGCGLLLAYASYIVKVPYDALRCSRYRLAPRKAQDVCINGMLFGNTSCGTGLASCGNICYDLEEHRCNSVLDCFDGEDELGCDTKQCPNDISCFNQTKCISPDQICDGKNDCNDGFDESHCFRFSCSKDNCNLKEKSSLDDSGNNSVFITVIIVIILLIIFFSLIFRCLTSRDSVRHTLGNPLDIPLPPFTGPEEESVGLEDRTYIDDDFRPGGEIFETFSHNLKKIKEKRETLMGSKQSEIIHVKPARISPSNDKHFNDGIRMVLSEELAALATLKISRDRCRGLKKAKSEEKPFTKLLFIDNKDSDETDENDEGCSSWSKTKLNKQSKSDGDQYLQRKTAETVV